LTQKVAFFLTKVAFKKKTFQVALSAQRVASFGTKSFLSKKLFSM